MVHTDAGDTTLLGTNSREVHGTDCTYEMRFFLGRPHFLANSFLFCDDFIENVSIGKLVYHFGGDA